MIAETYDLSILIKHNLFKKNHATKNGGAIRLLAASPVLFGNNFTENTASYEGGAIHMSYYSHAVIDSNTFTNNTGSTIGGALFVAHTSNPLITHNLFDSNEILNMGVAVGGGAITLWAHAFPEISENYIHANTAKAGSAIFCYELSAKKPGMASIHNNEIVNNLYYYPGGQGGDAIELVNSTSISITDNNIINPDVKYELLESLQEPYKGIADTVYTPYNYWGKDKMSEIEARIYHKYDDTKLPVVNYVPFYTDSIVNNF
jgi:hypothetical protein